MSAFLHHSPCARFLLIRVWQRMTMVNSRRLTMPMEHTNTAMIYRSGRQVRNENQPKNTLWTKGKPAKTKKQIDKTQQKCMHAPPCPGWGKNNTPAKKSHFTLLQKWMVKLQQNEVMGFPNTNHNKARRLPAIQYLVFISHMYCWFRAGLASSKS